jgi:hypothetical protein
MDIYLFNIITNLSYALIIGGLLVVLFTVGTHNENALIGTITGYSTTICATILLAGLTYATIATGDKKPQFKQIITTLIPFFVLFLILGFSITLESVYFDKIANNKIGDYYGFFSYMSVIFIFLQIGLFYGATTNKSFKENGIISIVTILKLLLLSLINFLILITLGVSLKYFSTDG